MKLSRVVFRLVTSATRKLQRTPLLPKGSEIISQYRMSVKSVSDGGREVGVTCTVVASGNIKGKKTAAMCSGW
jgi:hypothetical protein